MCASGRLSPLKAQKQKGELRELFSAVSEAQWSGSTRPPCPLCRVHPVYVVEAVKWVKISVGDRQ